MRAFHRRNIVKLSIFQIQMLVKKHSEPERGSFLNHSSTGFSERLSSIAFERQTN